MLCQPLRRRGRCCRRRCRLCCCRLCCGCRCRRMLATARQMPLANSKRATTESPVLLSQVCLLSFVLPLRQKHCSMEVDTTLHRNSVKFRRAHIETGQKAPAQLCPRGMHISYHRNQCYLFKCTFHSVKRRLFSKKYIAWFENEDYLLKCTFHCIKMNIHY